MPSIYDGSSLNGDDHADLPPRTRPGAPLVDAPLGQEWLSDLLGNRFQLLGINTNVPASLEVAGIEVEGLAVSTALDDDGHLQHRYLGNAEQAVYLFRPDQHVTARWIDYDENLVAAAVKRATGRG